MLKIDNAALVIIDVQGKLANLMEKRELLIANISRLIQGAKLLEIPVVATEQRPDKLGPTVSELAKLIPDITPIKKESFSCVGNNEFKELLPALNRDQVILAGIETHVCVYQTAVDLVELNYQVHVIADAVCSRNGVNHQYGLDRIQSEGAILSTTEIALFECIRTAADKRFKAMVEIVK